MFFSIYYVYQEIFVIMPYHPEYFFLTPVYIECLSSLYYQQTSLGTSYLTRLCHILAMKRCERFSHPSEKDHVKPASETSLNNAISQYSRPCVGPSHTALGCLCN